MISPHEVQLPALELLIVLLDDSLAAGIHRVVANLL